MSTFQGVLPGVWWLSALCNVVAGGSYAAAVLCASLRSTANVLLAWQMYTVHMQIHCQWPISSSPLCSAVWRPTVMAVHVTAVRAGTTLPAVALLLSVCGKEGSASVHI